MRGSRSQGGKIAKEMFQIYENLCIFFLFYDRQKPKNLV